AHYDRGLEIAPTNIDLIHQKAMTYVQEGDLAGARAVLDAAPPSVDPTALAAHVAVAYDLDWLLDEPRREVLLRMEPSAFGNDRATWAIVLAQAAARRGDSARVGELAEEARKLFAADLAQSPDHAVTHAFLGLSLAYLGRHDEAVREGEIGARIWPPEKN